MAPIGVLKVVPIKKLKHGKCLFQINECRLAQRNHFFELKYGIKMNITIG